MNEIEVRLHNMHGPTVFAVGSLEELPKLLDDWDRLIHSNAGYYRIVATFGDLSFELLPGEFVGRGEVGLLGEGRVFRLTNGRRQWWENYASEARS